MKDRKETHNGQSLILLLFTKLNEYIVV